jgi:hypothetical protein
VKTTVEIPDSLADEIRHYAAERGLSLKEVHERALRSLLVANKSSGEGFRLKMITTKGEGLQIEGGWDAIRDEIYR